MAAFEAGSGRRLVSYYSKDDGGEADLETFLSGVADEIRDEGSQGWRAVSTSVLPTRHVRGMLDTGSTRTSMYAAVVLYARD